MIDLKEVLAEWANDNQIHETHLDESSRKTPICLLYTSPSPRDS